ncbi:MAG: malonyl-CoA O-methyltransferase [Candidatus Marinamargulisbacteria bacterium]|jgi:malonyl-CoA O-methyltransferase
MRKSIFMTKPNVSSEFSLYASSYDRYAQIQRIVLDALAPKVAGQDPGTVIDIGCGTGLSTRALRKRFPTAKILAFDVSPKMIAQAKQLCREENISFEVNDAQTFSFPNSVDLIFSNVSFQWMRDLDLVLAKCRTGLRPGGTLAFSVFGPGTYTELESTLSRLLGKNIELEASRFRRPDTYKAMLTPLFNKVSVGSTVETLTFRDFVSLIRSIKYTGTKGSGISERRIWTRRLIAQADQLYRDSFRTIKASFHVTYCIAEDPK